MGEKLKPMSLWTSILLFGIPSIIFVFATRYGIPWLADNRGIPSVLSWFIVGGVIVFVPLFFASLIAYALEGNPTDISVFKCRFRLRPMTKADWLWTVGGTVVIVILMGLISLIAERLFTPLSTTPPFLDFDGLEPGQEWFLLVWIPFFFFNITGEEFIWRGYILPRQEITHGRWAWMINGLLWTIFHICFGIDLLIMLLPVFFIEPYVVQRQKNTWIGILIHTLVNGPAFIAVSLNWI